VAVLALGLVLVIAAAAFLIKDAEVVRKGQLLSYTEGTIYRIRVAGMTFRVEPDMEPESDLLNAYLLTGVGFIAFTFSLVLVRMRRSIPARAIWFFGVVAAGATYLAADEALGGHESIGHNAQVRRQAPVVR
jgi:NADH:ubiquinone oxidoreductase subunit 6 (subunit J)